MAEGSRHFAEASGRWVLILILAICISAASVWAYVFLNQKPPVAAGEIDTIEAVPTHFALRQGGTMQQGVGGGVERQDQLLVLVRATVRNQAKIPIFPFEQTGVLTLPTGEQKQARAVSATEMGSAFRAFPALAAARGRMPGAALPREATLAPGQSEQGLVLFAFPLTEEDWASRRGFDLEIPLRQQRELVLPETGEPGGK